MYMKFHTLILFSCYVLSSVACAQSQHHHGAEGVAPEALAKVGTVNFTTSCTASVQPQFERGVAMMHSFWYEEARLQFSAVAAADPHCAMAQWGLAMTEWRPLWDGMPESRRQAGIVEIDKATALHLTTDRESRYIAALSAYLHGNPASNPQLLSAYNAAMGALYAAYPKDLEAQAFYGLGLAAEQAAGGENSDEVAHKALAVLIPGFQAHPDHPGFAHYIIHVCDNPSLARVALPEAEHYAAVAPSSPHALHMPGHIFARLGMWPQDISTNLASVHASELAEHEHLDGVGHVLHAYEFLLYAYLQDGEDAKARQIEQIDPLLQHLGTLPDIQNDGMYAFHEFFRQEFPAIYHLERQEWKDVVEIPEIRGSSIPLVPFYRAWFRAIAAGHLRDAGIADQSAATAIATSSEAAAGGYPGPPEVHVMLLTVQAWQKYAHHEDAAAFALFQAAAEEQDRVGQAEVDIPVHEMYADLLLEAGRPADALVQYKTGLKFSPNRFHGLAGASRAAQASGQLDEARSFARQLLQTAHNGSDSTRPEIAQARLLLRKGRSANSGF
jgi:hypothetical protein